MKAQHIIASALCVLALSTAGDVRGGQGAATASRLEPLPRDLEIQLALSALPRHLREGATAYVLNPEKGFEVARKGTNGFHAFVARTGDDAFRGSWPLKAYRDDILYPVSFDAAGARQNMRVFFDAAQLQAGGMAPERLKETIQDRYRTNYYKAPDRAGVSYMMAPILRTYTNPDANEAVHTAATPHVMYYVPNVSNDDVGGAMPAADDIHSLMQHGHWRNTPDPFVILHGPHGYMVQFVGKDETAAIRAEYGEMLRRLCGIRADWCLPQ